MSKVEVTVDGVKYSPHSDKLTPFQIGEIHKILNKNYGFLAKSAKDSMIKDFCKIGASGSKSEIEKPKKPSKKKLKFDRVLSASNIKGLDEQGHLIFVRGKKRKSSYTIAKANDVWLWYSNSNITVTELADKFDLTPQVVRTILGSFENGVLNPWVDNWHSKQRAKKPQVQNNPEKRKEMGWF